MGVYRKKPVMIKAITFDEFVEYGKAHTTNVVNGMPWSFDYEGHPITHENDECYIIPTLEGDHHFTPQDMLITGIKGEIYPCKKDIFEKTYETVEITEGSPDWMAKAISLYTDLHQITEKFDNAEMKEFAELCETVNLIASCKG